jgi:hypothetical protein
VFFALFLDAAEMYAVPAVTGWILKHADAIGRWSAVGMWFVLLNFVQNIIAVPLQDAFATSPYLWSASIATVVILAVVGGVLHWRAIREQALSRTRRPAVGITELQPT